MSKRRSIWGRDLTKDEMVMILVFYLLGIATGMVLGLLTVEAWFAMNRAKCFLCILRLCLVMLLTPRARIVFPASCQRVRCENE